MICCIVSSLSAGGAERVMSQLANQWNARGHEVHLITLRAAVGDMFSLHRAIDRVALNVESESSSLYQAFANNKRKVIALRRAVVTINPDLVVSFVNKLNVLAILSCVGLAAPVLVSERTYPPSE